MESISRTTEATRSSLGITLTINIQFAAIHIVDFQYGDRLLYNLDMATKIQEQLTLEGAKIAVAASEKKAKEIGVDMNIAVVDASTHLLHFSRMSGAKITSISSMYLTTLI